MPKYRIVYKSLAGDDPCKWQLQERVFFVFWKRLYNFSSATSAANEILDLMEKLKLKNDLMTD